MPLWGCACARLTWIEGGVFVPVVVIANPKGGVGKSSLATQVAGYYASQGHPVLLGDADRQQTARWWLDQRPAAAAAIGSWNFSPDLIVRPPSDTTHVVLDTPSGFGGWRLDDVLNFADRVLVPLQPSAFDRFATQPFLEQLREHRHAHRWKLGLVGMRVDARTIAAERLREFMQAAGVPALAMLRDTQNYVHLAARGLSLFDLPPARVQRDLEQWALLCEWLSA
jgi:chromosome partitioning protein